METGKKLSAVQYWQWRQAISQMEAESEKLKSSELMLQGLAKDMEISRIKASLFKLQAVESAKEKAKLAQVQYNELKATIEQDLGISLNGCTIDDVTFEVKKLEE